MALPEIPKYGNYISLIPDSGIQFVDVEFQRDEHIPKRWLFDEAGKCIRRGDERVGPGRSKAAQDDYDDEGFDVELRDIVEMFEREWVPVPFLHRKNKDQFDQGPTNWVRAQLVPLTAGPTATTFRVVLAVDTRLVDRIDERYYLAPCAADAKAGTEFALPGFEDNSGPYFAQEWIKKWCFELYRRMVKRQDLRRKRLNASREEPSDEDVFDAMGDFKDRHLAVYRAFVDLLWVLQNKQPGDRYALPPMKLEKSNHLAPIDVTLVLDLGNSRTCGLITETDSSGHSVDWTKTDRLYLRDLSRPEHVYADPFPSRFVFADASFGFAALSEQTGYFEAFRWPSNVRIGVEAQWLSSQRRHVHGANGLSSPKRYLWDEDAQRAPWRTVEDGFAVDVATTLLVNEVGTPLHRLKPEDPDGFPAYEGRYARRNLTSLALTEVVLQAMSMMNSPGHRHAKLHDYTRPRRLRTLIMTTPTAMPVAERSILESQARNAVELAFLALGLAQVEPDAPDGVAWGPAARLNPKDPYSGPEVRLDWDEATATKAVFLYTQVARHYSGDARAFFDDYRHPANRNDPAMPADTLRLATIDVGGGTTDLVIASVGVEGQGSNVALLPRQEFREGFNLAGDDALLAVVNACVLAPLELALADCGASPAGVAALVSRLFSGGGGGQVAEQAQLRQQFAEHLAAPVGIALLHRYERYDPLVPASPETVRLQDLFPPGGFPEAIADQIARQCAAAGAPGLKLAELPVPVDFAAVDALVRAAFKKSLEALGEVIHRLRCDVLILSGRASRLPAVRAMLIEHSGLPAHRVVPMHGLDVGSWYPFRSPEGKVDDPKTTAAVGAVVCHLGGLGQLSNFPFRTAGLGYRSTARFFGKLDNARSHLPKADVFFDDLQLQDTEGGDEVSLEGREIIFQAAMPLGFRQLSVERWPATQLYWLKFASMDESERYRHALPLRIELGLDKSRDATVIEYLPDGRTRKLNPRLAVTRVEDRNGRTVPKSAVRLRLQTLGDEGGEGHWLDTGMLK